MGALGMGSHRGPDPNLTLVDHSQEDNKHGLFFMSQRTLFFIPKHKHLTECKSLV